MAGFGRLAGVSLDEKAAGAYRAQIFHPLGDLGVPHRPPSGPTTETKESKWLATRVVR
jgi:hypothetical protein